MLQSCQYEGLAGDTKKAWVEPAEGGNGPAYHAGSAVLLRDGQARAVVCAFEPHVRLFSCFDRLSDQRQRVFHVIITE